MNFIVSVESLLAGDMIIDFQNKTLVHLPVMRRL